VPKGVPVERVVGLASRPIRATMGRDVSPGEFAAADCKANLQLASSAASNGYIGQSQLGFQPVFHLPPGQPPTANLCLK